MRVVAPALALAVALAGGSGCHRPAKVTGHHPAVGLAAGEEVAQTFAYVCDPDTERCSYATADLLATAPRALVIPAPRLAVGDVIEHATSADWFVVTAIEDTGVTAGPHTLRWDRLRIPTAKAAALDRRDRRMMITIGALSIAFTLGLLVLARFLQKRKGTLRAVAEATIGASVDANVGATVERPPGASDASALAMLSCRHCGAPVRLVAQPTTECASCHQPVEIPPAYVSLAASRRVIEERLPREAAAFRRAQLLGHPLVGAAVIVSAYAAYRGYDHIARTIVDGGLAATTSLVQFMLTFPLLFAPIGLVITGVAALLGGAQLRERVPALAATKTDRGYGCRGCGAPLGATEDGVAELCLYCGAQNLIASGLAASASDAKRHVGALGASIRAASAAFWSRVAGFWVPPLYVIGVIGLVIYPFILWVGLAT